MPVIDQLPIYQVSQLNAEAKQLLEDSFQLVWVLGEISNLAAPASGHLYFSLKDTRAAVKCALFKQSGRRLNFTPASGQQVLIQARVTLYEARGDFQLVVQQMQLAGDGALQLAFLQLKEKLATEGLFETIYKKPLPQFPQCVGVVTSASGAAIHDIIHVTQRRCPLIKLIIYPTLVQGKEAAPNIVQAISMANQRDECDVLLLARGGGSLEDLWPFNEEIVARAIFNSQLPIISGIGHESDFTIADFVADVRAPTPSAAAEIISPDLSVWLNQFTNTYQRLTQQLQQQFKQAALTLNSLQKRLRHPKQQLLMTTQQLMTLCQRLINSGQHHLKQDQEQLAHLSQQLHLVSPLQTLARGYAIASLAKGHIILRDQDQVNLKDEIHIQLAKGSLSCQVLKKET